MSIFLVDVIGYNHVKMLEDVKTEKQREKSVVAATISTLRENVEEEEVVKDKDEMKHFYIIRDVFKFNFNSLKKLCKACAGI